MSATIFLFRRGVPTEQLPCCSGQCIDGVCPTFPVRDFPEWQEQPARRGRTLFGAVLAIALIAGGALLLIGFGHGEPTAIALGASR